MVKDPVLTTLATAEPLMVPKNALLTTATLAGPPRKRPMLSMAMSVKKRAPRLALSNSPNNRKAMTMVQATATVLGEALNPAEPSQ